MADVRFKISGDTPSFVAKLYDNSARSTVLQQKFVDYSGTCVTFGNLPQISKYYFVKVCDAIGNIATGITCTSGSIIATTSLATKAISMGGIGYYDPEYPSNCTIGDVCANNHIIVNPPLISGESVDLTLNVHMDNTSEAYANTMFNEIRIFCKPAGSPTYAEIYHKCCCSTATATITPKLCYGDNICYQLMSADNTGMPGTEVSGYLNLCLSNVSNAVGFIPARVAPTLKSTCINTVQPTTTTSTTVAPIIIGLNVTQLCPIPPSSEPWYNHRASAKLTASPALSAGQSFRLCYIDSASSIVGGGGTVKAISSSAYVQDNLGTCINVVTSGAGPGQGSCNKTCCKYLTINCDNINNYTFFADAKSHTTNINCSDHSTQASASLNKLVCQCNGTYQIGLIGSVSVVVIPPTPQI